MIKDSGSLTNTHSQTAIRNPRLLVIARGVWLVFMLAGLSIFVLGIPAFVSPDNVQFTTTDPFFYVVIDIFTVGGFLLFSSIIVARRFDNWMVLYTVWAMLFFGLLNSVIYVSYVRASPVLSLLNMLGVTLLYAFIMVFPDGRFQPRWTIGLLAGFALWHLVLRHIFGDTLRFAYSLIDFAFILLALVVYIHRYRKFFSPARKQQTKWIIFGTAVAVISIQIRIVLMAFLETTVPEDLYTLIFVVSYPIVHVMMFLVPLSVMFAALRFRLWDIDFVIERGLVFGLSTLIVVVLLVFEFWLGYTVFIPLLGQEQATIVLIIGAMIAGLLFNPIRKYIENFIDHRLYGLRYNIHEVAEADKTLEVKNPGALTGQRFGKYELLGVIGKGGMGEVYKGFGDGTLVAVKVLPQDLAKDANLVKRFEREAMMLSRLNHPHIVKLQDSGQTERGEYYLAMEYIEGYELGHFAKTHTVSYEDIREWLTIIADALDYIHKHGLVHRDIKPSNIMLRLSNDNETWHPILMDFGIAHVDYAGTQLTGTGTIGTIDYMAPEQIMAATEVDYRADIYSLGVVLYELITGERLYKGSAGQILFAHLQQPPPDPRDMRPDVPKHIVNAVIRALSKKPEDRFQSATELAQALA